MWQNRAAPNSDAGTACAAAQSLVNFQSRQSVSDGDGNGTLQQGGSQKRKGAHCQKRKEEPASHATPNGLAGRYRRPLRTNTVLFAAQSWDRRQLLVLVLVLVRLAACRAAAASELLQLQLRLADLLVPVFGQQVLDERADAVRHHTAGPAQLSHRVVQDSFARVAARLERKAKVGTQRRRTDTLAHWDRVASVVHVRDGQRVHVRMLDRERQVQPQCSHALSRRLKGHCRVSKRHSNQRAKCTAEAVSSDPDLRIRVRIGDVVEQIRGRRVEERALDKGLCQARRRACLPILAMIVVAVANGMPGPADPSTAAREKEIVLRCDTGHVSHQCVKKARTPQPHAQAHILLIAFRCRAIIQQCCTGALERDDDSRIVGRPEDVSTDAIRHPTK